MVISITESASELKHADTSHEVQLAAPVTSDRFRFIADDFFDYRFEFCSRIGCQSADRDIRNVITIQVGVSIIGRNIGFGPPQHIDACRNEKCRCGDRRGISIKTCGTLASVANQQNKLNWVGLVKFNQALPNGRGGTTRMDAYDAMPLLSAMLYP